MAKVTGILCQMITSNIDDAGTDGAVYLGLGGREFLLDSQDNDFQRGSACEYFLGAPPIPGPNDIAGSIRQRRVLEGDKNNPRKGLPLDTDNLDRTPVYIRFEPEGSRTDDHWNLRYAAVLVYHRRFFIGYLTSDNFDNLWFGHKTGKILYLTTEFKEAEPKVLAQGRTLAAQMKS